MSIADESYSCSYFVTRRVVYTSLRTTISIFQIRLKFFNRSSCSIVGTDFLGQFFTSSGHSDWPTDIHSPRQRYNLIYRLPQLQRWLRGEKITSFTAPTKIKKQIEERFKLSNEHIMPCGRFFVYTSGRQTQVKKITLFHYTTEKTAWGDSVSFHHQFFVSTHWMLLFTVPNDSMGLRRALFTISGVLYELVHKMNFVSRWKLY